MVLYVFQERKQVFSAILYECVTQEKPEMLPTYIAIDQAVKMLAQGEVSESVAVGQLGLVLDVCECRVLQERMRTAEGRGLLLSSEFLPRMKCSVDNTLDHWLCDNRQVLRAYLSGQALSQDMRSCMLACYLVYHSVPRVGRETTTLLTGCRHFVELLVVFSRLGVPVRSVMRLAPLLLPSTPGSPF
ncbi:hypothetical protein COCON_G00227350 [Conger conger]|uniref:Anaphase-promoting complex subunit 1 C-terminal domain-containing protein n=1 Tax=Conger conger TaxID=82655 RepID=A0A9Q1CXI8_CONCO|nr:hypothetical protein COCON_G00227350 [Conger conger]